MQGLALLPDEECHPPPPITTHQGTNDGAYPSEVFASDLSHLLIQLEYCIIRTLQYYFRCDISRIGAMV